MVQIAKNDYPISTNIAQASEVNIPHLSLNTKIAIQYFTIKIYKLTNKIPTTTSLTHYTHDHKICQIKMSKHKQYQSQPHVLN